ncbi:hypothetical protein niasHT_024174 [Heterodera trifolii]|uniref:Katanin p80 subunit C-terminal domain-containing protein n=1 Tax=Heterodera trifolii TaxID=157864 RepID=A0ABD2JLT5_9BILA
MVASSFSHNGKSVFASPFKLTGECKLLYYCTNELGHFLNQTSNALIGNPLRIVPFDGLSSPQKQICTNTSNSLELNCTERYISLTNGTALWIYDLQKGSTLRELHDHDGNISGVAWHRQSPWLLASVGDDCTLRLWDLRSHPAQIAIRRATKPYRRLEFSPDCNYIACAGELVSIYDLCMAQNVVHMLSCSPSSAVRFNPSECLLATADDDRTVRFWDVDTGECVTQTSIFNAKIGQIHFEPNGKYLIAVTEKQMASIRWEPFELVSQFDLSHQLHFPFSASNYSSQTKDGANENPKLHLLDMEVKNGRLNQLVVLQNSDPSKCATVYSASLSLSHLEKCGISTNSSADLECISSKIPQQFSTIALDNDLLDKKEEDDFSPEPALSSTPGSLLDSLVIDQDEQDNDTGMTETETNKDEIMSRSLTKSSVHMSNSRRNASLSQRNGASSSSNDGTLVFRDPTTHLQRPSRLIISEHKNAGQLCSNNNDSQKPASLIRRGSSLHDMANCASTSDAAITHNPSLNAVGISKAFVNPSTFSSSSSTMSSSSSNASSSNVSSSVAAGDPLKRRSESEIRSLDEFMQISPKLKATTNKMKIEAGTLLSGLGSIQLNKAEFIVNAVAYFEELHIFAKLLHDFLRQPRDHSLALCAAFLPRVELLLKHKNKEYPPMALDFLEMVLTSYGEAIRHGLSSRDFSIGVDVAAEQRFDRCTKCKNALLQIRMNSSYCVDRLDEDQHQRFDNLMALVDNISNSF